MLVAMVVVEILVLRHLQSFKLCVRMLCFEFQVIPLRIKNFVVISLRFGSFFAVCVGLPWSWKFKYLQVSACDPGK